MVVLRHDSRMDYHAAGKRTGWGGSAGAGAMEGAGGPSAIKPIEPMGAAMPAGPEKMGAWENGRAVDIHQDIVAEHQSNADKAAALWQMMSAST